MYIVTYIFAEMLGRFHIIFYFCSGILIKQF